MRDPINPLRSEIRDWAFEEGALEPVQDWDLHLASLREFDLYIELAADDSCPSWDYFLRVLYLLVGDAVRTNFQTQSTGAIKEILAMTEPFPRHRLHLFRKRSRELLDDPSKFNYDDWCAGMLVARDLSHAAK